VKRWLVSLRRAGYILGIAICSPLELGGQLPTPTSEITKVDILNCMGWACGAGRAGRGALEIRAHFAAAADWPLAAASPVIANLNWSGVRR